MNHYKKNQHQLSFISLTVNSANEAGERKSSKVGGWYKETIEKIAINAKKRIKGKKLKSSLASCQLEKVEIEKKRRIRTSEKGKEKYQLAHLIQKPTKHQHRLKNQKIS